MLGEAISRAGAVRQKACDRRAGTLGFENLNLSAGRPKQLGFENELQTSAVSTEVNRRASKACAPMPAGGTRWFAGRRKAAAKAANLFRGVIPADMTITIYCWREKNTAPIFTRERVTG